MATVEVNCLHCSQDKVYKHGFSGSGIQRFRCRSCLKTFWLSSNYTNRGVLGSVKQQIIDMAINGAGIRDTARVLQISQNTVISTRGFNSQVQLVD